MSPLAREADLPLGTPAKSNPMQEEESSNNDRLANLSSQSLSLVLFKIPMLWGLNQLSVGKEG